MFRVLALAAAGLAAIGPSSAPRAQVATTPFSAWTLHTVGGTGLPRPDPRDGRAATATRISPGSITVLADGTIAWTSALDDDARVRTIAPDGRVGTLAGTGRRGFRGDGGLATRARLSEVRDVAALPGGGVLIVDGERVRAVDAAGIIRTVAGSGTVGFSGDGGPAISAQFRDLGEVAPLPDGGFVVTDIGNERVRRVDPGGIITTIAGTGTSGFTGDGGPAPLAQLHLEWPSGLVVAADGAVLFGEWGNHAIRRIGADGIISRVAGTGHQVGRDGPLPAAEASLDGPVDLVGLPDGGILVSDQLRLRHIGADGVLREQRMPGCTNAVGDGPLPPIEEVSIFLGDGRPVGCSFNGGDLAQTADSSILVSELGRLRMLASPKATTPAVAITDSTVRRRSVAVTFVTTIAGRAELRLVHNGQTLRATSTGARRGRNRIRLKRRLVPGVYRLRLRARGAAGAVAHDRVAVLAGRLSARTARRAVTRNVEWFEDPSFGRCRRFSARRVDCISQAYGDACFVMYAIVADSSGFVGFRRYSCPEGDRTPFRRHPEWNFDALTPRIPYPPFQRPGTVPAPLP